MEFKESPRLKAEICQAVSALSNANGGLILAGISDSGIIIGVELNERHSRALKHIFR